VLALDDVGEKPRLGGEGVAEPVGGLDSGRVTGEAEASVPVDKGILGISEEHELGVVSTGRGDAADTFPDVLAVDAGSVFDEFSAAVAEFMRWLEITVTAVGRDHAFCRAIPVVVGVILALVALLARVTLKGSEDHLIAADGDLATRCAGLILAVVLVLVEILAVIAGFAGVENAVAARQRRVA
jgi:hypothetical protein